MREEAAYKPLIMQLQTLLPNCRLYVNDKKAFTATGHPMHINLCPGSADLVGWVNGRWLEVEVKKPGEDQSEKQVDHEQLVKSQGGLYFLAKLDAPIKTVAERLVKEITNAI